MNNQGFVITSDHTRASTRVFGRVYVYHNLHIYPQFAGLGRIEGYAGRVVGKTSDNAIKNRALQTGMRDGRETTPEW